MKIFIWPKYLLCLLLTCSLLKYSNALTWDQLTKTAMWGTSEISDMLEPYIVEHFPSANVSKQCKSSLITYAEGIKNFEPWAVKMFDATGKPPSSFLRNTLADFGLFDECMALEIDSRHLFRSQFCMLSLRSSLLPVRLHKKDKESYIRTHGYPPEWAVELPRILHSEWNSDFGLYLGICIPSTCSERDLTSIISAYVKPAELQVSLSDCQVNEPRQWTKMEKLAIFLLTSWIIIIMIVTGLDIFERNKKQKDVLCCDEGTMQKILKTFSVISNLEILLKQKTTDDSSLDFIHGMKFWSVMWVLFLHTFGYETLWGFKRMRNFVNYYKFRQAYTILYENSLPNTTYFIFLNGFISTYSLKNKQSNQKEKKRTNGILKLILIKYFRVVPSIIFLMMMAFVVPVTFNGPIWNSHWEDYQNKCLKNGWMNLIFASNFVSYNEHCFVHMWVLSSLFQYHIICLPILSLSKRRPKLAFTIGFLIAFGCGVRDFLISVYNDYHFCTVYRMGSITVFHDFARKIYFKPFNHFATFGIGMIFGWVNLKNFKMSKLSLTLCWGFYVLYTLALYYVVRFPTDNLYFTSFHNAFRGTFFSLQMGWVIYTCLNGSAGILGRFFAWKALIPFSKILNSVTMYHPILIITYEAMRRERFYTSIQNYAQYAFALIVFSFLLGAILFLMVDSPVNRLCDMWEGKNIAPTQKNFGISHSDESVSKTKEKKS